MKHTHLTNNSLIDRTLHVWQTRMGRQLSREDARQIIANATGFFAILSEWSRAERAHPRTNTRESAQVPMFGGTP